MFCHFNQHDLDKNYGKGFVVILSSIITFVGLMLEIVFVFFFSEADLEETTVEDLSIDPSTS